VKKKFVFNIAEEILPASPPSLFLTNQRTDNFEFQPISVEPNNQNCHKKKYIAQKTVVCGLVI